MEDKEDFAITLGIKSSAKIFSPKFNNNQPNPIGPIMQAGYLSKGSGSLIANEYIKEQQVNYGIDNLYKEKSSVLANKFRENIAKSIGRSKSSVII